MTNIVKLIMKPRKPSSDPKKSSQVPLDLIEEIKKNLAENKVFFQNKKVAIEGLIFTEEIALSLIVSEVGSLRELNFESSIDFNSEESKALDKINLCGEALCHIVEDYVGADGDIELPFEWTPFDYGGTSVFLRFHTLNSKLEEMADALLAEHPEHAMDDTQVH